jgi:aryl-alcohol dehydrogenase-like predicted oxidoreductase
MQKAVLGRTGLEVTRLGFGAKCALPADVYEEAKKLLLAVGEGPNE